MKSFLALLLICGAAPVFAADEDAAISQLVHTFLDAEVHADNATLRRVTSEQFVEISPLGNLDPREKWLGFYPEKVAEAQAQFAVDDTTVRQFGDSAILTAKVTFTVAINGVSRTKPGRMNFVAHKEGTQWKLVSAQVTPIRPPAKS